MNEPASFVDGTSAGCTVPGEKDYHLDNPPYIPSVVGGKLYYHTLCLSAQQFNGSHYDLHNLYGYHELISTYRFNNSLSCAFKHKMSIVMISCLFRIQFLKFF